MALLRNIIAAAHSGKSLTTDNSFWERCGPKGRSISLIGQ